MSQIMNSVLSFTSKQQINNETTFCFNDRIILLILLMKHNRVVMADKIMVIYAQ